MLVEGSQIEVPKTLRNFTLVKLLLYVKLSCLAYNFWSDQDKLTKLDMDLYLLWMACSIICSSPQPQPQGQGQRLYQVFACCGHCYKLLFCCIIVCRGRIMCRMCCSCLEFVLRWQISTLVLIVLLACQSCWTQTISPN